MQTHAPNGQFAAMQIERGRRFGRLAVAKEVESAPDGARRFLCRCDCGTEKAIRLRYLTSGKTKSCGCLRREITSETKGTHRQRQSRLYGIWSTMKSRCLNPAHRSYKDYGGRGITICHEWRQFPAFHAWALAHGYRDDLTIERVDVNGNYEPSNCTWIPMSEQSKNRRPRSSRVKEAI